jgi:histidinol-phosphate aminotransferase
VPAVVNLAENTNVLGPCRGAVEAVAREAAGANQYPERQRQDLVAALAALHGVGADQVMIGNGAQHVIRVIAQTFLAPGDRAVGLAPTYPGYGNASTVMRAHYETLPAVDGGYDTEAWVRAAATARIAWLCTPNNPTGCALPAASAERIVRALPPDGLAVIDQTYRDFADDASIVDGVAMLRGGAPVIVVHTFSKLYALAGLRIGYALASASHIGAMLQRLDTFPVNRAGQAAAVEALRDTAHQAATLAFVRQGRRQIEAGLRQLGVPFFPSQANFVTARFGDAAPRVLESARNAGYALRSMDGIWGLPGWIRITVGLEHHNADVLRVLAAALAGTRS